MLYTHYLVWLPYLPCSSSLTTTSCYVNPFFSAFCQFWSLIPLGSIVKGNLHDCWSQKLFVSGLQFKAVFSGRSPGICRKWPSNWTLPLLMVVLRMVFFVLLKISLLIILSFHSTLLLESVFSASRYLRVCSCWDISYIK